MRSWHLHAARARQTWLHRRPAQRSGTAPHTAQHCEEGVDERALARLHLTGPLCGTWRGARWCADEGAAELRTAVGAELKVTV